MEKYLAIFKLSFFETLKNTKALMGLSLFLITCLLIFANLWKIIATKLEQLGLSSDQLLWYIALNEWILVSLPSIHDDIEQDYRSGRLAYQLHRPISYLGSILMKGLGILSAHLLVLGFITFSFTWIYTKSLPFQSHPFCEWICVCFFTALASLLALFYLCLIGLSAFWLQDVRPFYLIWEKCLFIFGGLILPLSIYPQWMQSVAKWTPFPIILGERSLLALSFTFSHGIYLTVSLAIWLIIAFTLLTLCYRKSLTILTIQGG